MTPKEVVDEVDSDDEGDNYVQEQQSFAINNENGENDNQALL